MQTYQKLEHEWAEALELDPAGMVACSSGTAALHLALECLYEDSDDPRIVVPEFTMIACARAAILAGLRVALVDCRDDLLIDPEKIPSGLPGTMYVHIYGRICDIENSGGFIIEDLAEAHGISPSGNTDAACWSFYQNKIVAGEEGGAVWFRNPAKARRARELKSLGFTEKHNFLHIPRGHNYRLSNTHAELIRNSLRELKSNLERRTIVESWYDFLTPPEFRMPPRNIPWVYDIRIPGMSLLEMDVIIEELNREGIAARHGFKPMSMQTEFLHFGFSRLNAYRASCEVLYLPIRPEMSYTQVTESMNSLIRLVEATVRK